ncbi:NUDIX domain-containing protein [Rhodobacteraceae bacterium nBUS_24]
MDQNEFTTLGEWQGYSKERVAALLVMDQHDRLLLQFRDCFPHIAHPGRWSMFGGHVEGSEDLRQTCAREIKEEFGINLDLQSLVPFVKLVCDPPELVDQIYVFTTRERIQVSQISLGEGAGFGVFTPMQLKTLDIPRSVRPVIEHFISEHMSN